MAPSPGEQIRAAIDSVAAGAPTICATLSVKGREDELWLQLVRHSVNARYPHTGDPKPWLARLPKLAGEIDRSWENDCFLTIHVTSVPDEAALPQWIEAYFVQVLGMEPGAYELELDFMDLDWLEPDR